MRSVRHGVGTFTAGEKWRALTPTRQPATARRAVLYCHQNGGLASSLTAGAPYYEFVPDRLGAHLVAGDFGGSSTWGNDASITALDSMVDGLLAQGKGLGCATDKVCLYGGSMGTLTALNYLVAHPTKVAAVVCVLPAVALDAVHDASPERFTNAAAVLEAAYTNLAGFNAALPTHDPSARTAAVAATGVPIGLWYSSNDALVLPAEVESFAAGVGATATLHSMGPVGHTFLYDALAEELAAYLAAYV